MKHQATLRAMKVASLFSSVFVTVAIITLLLLGKVDAQAREKVEAAQIAAVQNRDVAAPRVEALP